MRKSLLVVLSLVCSIAYGGDGAPVQHFSNAGRTVAIADVHGAFDAMVSILQQAGVIAQDRTWRGGISHLVIVGDLLDRGPDSRRVMDLLMALESQAIDAGGRVHVVLGNHEAMNLVGDLRYVSSGEYAAFAPDESTEMRERAWREHIEYFGAPDDEAAARAEFDGRFPPGFFAHRAAFTADGQYGKWLLEKPIIVSINDTAFMHGGLSEQAAASTFGELNRQAGEQLGAYLREFEQLLQAGVLPVTSEFYERSEMLDAYAAQVAAGTRSWTSEVAASALRLKELRAGFIHSMQSPLWYRGNVSCGALIEEDRLELALHSAGVVRLVVGHTPTPGRRVLSRFAGDLYEIDTGMLTAYYGGQASALILEDGGVSVIYQNELGAAEALAQPRRVGLRISGADAAELASILATGAIVARSDDEQGGAVMRLALGERVIAAALMPYAGRQDFFPEVAAYRLDRRLGLDMVPVTVKRQVDGRMREVQYLPPRTVDEAQRAGAAMGGSANCPLQDQIDALYVFDALIGNAARLANQIRYSTDNWQMILVGHQRAFGGSRGRPAHLKNVELDLTPGWRERLGELDQSSLEGELGDVLSKKRIKALLKRRDELLKS